MSPTARIAILLLALVSATLVASSCRTTKGYEGDKRSREEIAVLKVPYYPKGHFITVETVDDRRIDAEANNRVGILPGHRVLSGRARGFGQSREGTPYSIGFAARAGATYSLSLIQGRFTDKLRIVVIDELTSDEVSSIEIWP